MGLRGGWGVSDEPVVAVMVGGRMKKKGVGFRGGKYRRHVRFRCTLPIGFRAIAMPMVGLVPRALIDKVRPQFPGFPSTATYTTYSLSKGTQTG
jgi:hypothetical protein